MQPPPIYMRNLVVSGYYFKISYSYIWEKVFFLIFQVSVRVIIKAVFALGNLQEEKILRKDITEKKTEGRFL